MSHRTWDEMVGSPRLRGGGPGKEFAVTMWVARVRRSLRHAIRNGIAVMMLVVSRSVFTVKLTGRENISYHPGTILAYSHKHDMDIPVLVPSLYFRRGHLHELHRLYAATRDDLFETGFLCLYFQTLDWLRPAIAKLCIDGLFYICQAGPVKLPDEQTVNQLLQEFRRTEADLPLDMALTDEWLTRLVGPAYADHAKRMAEKWPPFVLPRPPRPRKVRQPSPDRPPLAERYIIPIRRADAAETSLEEGLAAVKKVMERHGAEPGRGPADRTIAEVVAERTVSLILHSVWPVLRKVGLPLRVLLWLARAARPNPNKRLVISDAILRAPLPVLAEYATPRMFREPLAGRIRERHHALLHHQLGFLTRVLDKQGFLMIAPEGRVTPDGRFGKMRAALTRVVQQARVDPVMLPINLTYDFMDSRKPHLFVRFGKEVTGLKAAARVKNDLADIVRVELAGRATITMSQLASAHLVAAAGQGTEVVSAAALRDFVRDTARRMAGYGLAVDERLADPMALVARLRGFLAYASRAGLLSVIADGQEMAQKAITADSTEPDALVLRLNRDALLRAECRTQKDNPPRYCLNELASLLDAQQITDDLLATICTRHSDVAVVAPAPRRARISAGATTG